MKKMDNYVFYLNPGSGNDCQCDNSRCDDLYGNGSKKHPEHFSHNVGYYFSQDTLDEFRIIENQPGSEQGKRDCNEGDEESIIP